MTALAFGAIDSAVWIGLVVCGVLAALAAAPVAAFFWLICARDPFDRATLDVERFVELRDRARLELGQMPRGLSCSADQERQVTAAIERFVAIRDEARTHLWPRRAVDARPPRTSEGPTPVSTPVFTRPRKRKGAHMRVFVAGASGAIGRRFVPQLVDRGHSVVATTTRPEKVDLLRSLGAHPLVVDGLDELAIGEAIARAEPDAIVHQMTALADMTNLRRFDNVFARTNELRTRGTDYLLAAALAAGVDLFVAQSYTGWPNIREGGPVKNEADPFDPSPPRTQSESLAAIRHLERAVTTATLRGTVLRYGNFYGPGASEGFVDLVHKRRMPIVGDGAGIWSWIHIDDAAAATLSALEQGRPGIYNIVDDDPAPVSEWLPYLAESVGAPPPRRVPIWLARLAAGEAVVSWMTQGRGSSNDKARRELGWAPLWASWRQGFRSGLVDRAAGISEPDDRTAA